MTENLSLIVLAGVVTVSGAVAAPVLGSEASQKFFRMLPGEVLLASLDAFNKVLEAAEVAGKDALSAASDATVEIVTHRFGEEAGEVTHDTFEVAGHVIGTAWNVTKVRKAINPATNGTLSASALKLLSLKNASKAITNASK
jgi:spartin